MSNFVSNTVPADAKAPLGAMAIGTIYNTSTSGGRKWIYIFDH